MEAREKDLEATLGIFYWEDTLECFTQEYLRNKSPKWGQLFPEPSGLSHKVDIPGTPREGKKQN